MSLNIQKLLENEFWQQTRFSLKIVLFKDQTNMIVYFKKYIVIIKLIIDIADAYLTKGIKDFRKKRQYR